MRSSEWCVSGGRNLHVTSRVTGSICSSQFSLVQFLCFEHISKTHFEVCSEHTSKTHYPWTTKQAIRRRRYMLRVSATVERPFHLNAAFCILVKRRHMHSKRQTWSNMHCLSEPFHDSHINRKHMHSVHVLSSDLFVFLCVFQKPSMRM